MSCTIDHLRVDHTLRVLRDFTDLNGQHHRANETGVVRRLAIDWSAQAVVLEWERSDRRETMRFALNAQTGPRNGAMRDFFEMGEARPSARSTPVKTSTRKTRVVRPESWPMPSPEVITDVAQWDAAVQRIAGLAARSRFADVDAQISALLVDVGPTGWRLRKLADDLGDLAVAHAYSEDRTIYVWLRDRSINLMHAWGSCATSGGEGAVCGDAIEDSKRRFARLETI
jgi:hypothetical protein